MASQSSRSTKNDNLSRFSISVQQTYAFDATVADAQVITELQDGLRTYYKFVHAGKILLMSFDHVSGSQKMWTESLGHVLVTDLPSVPRNRKRKKLPEIVYKKEIRNICGVKCYPIRIIVKGDDLKSVDWVSAKDPGEDVALSTYVSGKLVESEVKVEWRPGRPEDLKTFDFPYGVQEVRASRNAAMDVWGQFVLEPILSKADDLRARGVAWE